MGKTVLIIPLGQGSKWENNELRFTLRSIEKHLTGFDEVMIAGDHLPDWLTGVDKVEFGDVSRFAAINTLEKVKQCLRYTNADQFLLSYDDVFLNKNFIADEFPDYYNGELNNFLKMRGDYKTSCMKTFKWLKERGFKTKKFGVHCPFLFNRNLFIEVTKMFKNEEPGLLYKSIYGNLCTVNPEFKKDIIINLPLNLPGNLSTLPFYSIRDGKVNYLMQNFFQEQFPNKSQFEA
jgi:hypothetical protein